MKQKNSQLAANSRYQMRIPIYLPVNQVKNNGNKKEWFFKSQAGSVLIRNYRLTQEHRNIIDAIFTHYPPHFYDSGSCIFIFTIYDLQKKLSKKSKSNNEWIKKKFDELQGVQIKVCPVNHSEISKSTFSVLNQHRKHRQKVGRTNKPLYSVTFNADYIEFFAQDLWVHTEQLTRKIINLKLPGPQALVRHCLSHNRKNQSLSNLMQEIGASNKVLSKATVAKIRGDILSRKEFLEQDFGIILDSKIEGYSERNPLVKYKKHQKVWFENLDSEKSN